MVPVLCFEQKAGYIFDDCCVTVVSLLCNQGSRFLPQAPLVRPQSLSRNLGDRDGVNRKNTRLLQGHSACVQGGACGKYIIDHKNALVFHI